MNTVYVIVRRDVCTIDYEGWEETNVIGVVSSADKAISGLNALAEEFYQGTIEYDADGNAYSMYDKDVKERSIVFDRGDEYTEFLYEEYKIDGVCF